jgi:hypothetical protein
VTPPCAHTRRAAGSTWTPFHRRQVDHEAAIGDGLAGDVVATAADGHLEVAFAAEADGVDDVSHGVAPGDERRALVDEPVVDTACSVIGVIGGGHEGPPERGANIAWHQVIDQIGHVVVPSCYGPLCRKAPPQPGQRTVDGLLRLPSHVNVGSAAKTRFVSSG